MLTASRSGELNAKNRELLALQAQARARLAKTRASFADGMKAAKDVQRDLEWTQKRVQYAEEHDFLPRKTVTDTSQFVERASCAKVPRSVSCCKSTLPSVCGLLKGDSDWFLAAFLDFITSVQIPVILLANLRIHHAVVRFD